MVFTHNFAKLFVDWRNNSINDVTVLVEQTKSEKSTVSFGKPINAPIVFTYKTFLQHCCALSFFCYSISQLQIS